MEFKVGERVLYVRLKREAVVASVGSGLGYYIDCAGFRWSVPETALARIPSLPENNTKDHAERGGIQVATSRRRS